MSFLLKKSVYCPILVLKNRYFFVILPRKQHRDDMYRDLLTIER